MLEIAAMKGVTATTPSSETSAPPGSSTPSSSSSASGCTGIIEVHEAAEEPEAKDTANPEEKPAGDERDANLDADDEAE